MSLPWLVIVLFLAIPAVTSAASDTTAPFLTQLSFPTDPLNTTYGADYLPVRIEVSDDLSGFETGSIHLEGPTGAALGYSFHSSPTTVNIEFPQYSAEGIWVVDLLGVHDEVGNGHYYDTAELEALGFPTTVEVADEPTTSTSTTEGSPGTTSTTIQSPTTTTTAPTTSTSTTSTTMLPATTTTTARQTIVNFSDVGPDHRFHDEILWLASRRIIEGYVDGTFGPDDPVLRAQLAKMVTIGLNIHDTAPDNVESPTFSDVPYDGRSYPFDFVEEAAAAGLVNGYANGTFGPYDKLTRVQLVRILVRAGGSDLVQPPSGYSVGFQDVAAEDMHYVAVAKYNRLVDGKSDTRFAPYDTATRGHVAKILYNLMAQMGLFG